jgi:hypothetical protein
MTDRDECKPRAVPEGWGGGLEAAADLVSGAARFSLSAATWPAMVLPRFLRRGFARGIRLAVQAAGILPHAVARGANSFADDFGGAEE